MYFFSIIIQITLHLMNHLRYWISLKKISLKKQQQKFERKQHSGSSLQAIYLLRCYSLKFIYIAGSTGTNKRLPMRTIGYHMCFVLLSFGIGGYRSSLELFVTNVNGWKLLLLLQRVPSYMWQGSQIRLWKAQKN